MHRSVLLHCSNKVFKCQWALRQHTILETEDTSSVLQASAKFKVADLESILRVEHC